MYQRTSTDETYYDMKFPMVPKWVCLKVVSNLESG
jgi:hypothetical protein